MLFSLKCAWCGRHMGIKEWETPHNDSPLVSHTICGACSTNMLNDVVISQSAGILPAGKGAESPKAGTAPLPDRNAR